MRHYRVENRLSKTITKFYNVSDAVCFCIHFGIDPTSIQTYVDGEEIEFEFI